MITEEKALTIDRQQLIETLYWEARDKSAWLTKLVAALQLSPEETQYLEWLDDAQRSVDSKMVRWEREIEAGGGWELAAIEDDAVKLSRINERIFAVESAYEESIQNSEPYFNRAVLLENAKYKRLCQLRDKSRACTVHAEHPEYSRIPESDIALAKAHPLENLVELDRAKRMLCPFHKDKRPSMWVKGGWGYCFSCGAWCDSIKYLREVKGMKFTEAVRSLIGRG